MSGLLRLFGIAFVAILTGCAPMEIPQMPAYLLDYGEPVAQGPQPVSVEIRNGAGQYIYTGPAGKQSANPELSLFDGMLHIKTLWSDNKYTEQTLRHPAGKPVSLGWDNDKKQHYVITGRAATRPTAQRQLPPKGYPTRITIVDDRGNVLYQGSPDEDDEYDAFVPNERAGKLSITTEWSEGPPTTQELPYSRGDLRWDEWGDYVWFSWDFDSNQYVIDPPRQWLRAVATPAIEVYGGIGRLKRDAPTLGVNVGPDTPLFRGAEKIDFGNFGLGVSIGRLGPFNAKVGLDLKWGDETNRIDTAMGNRGFTFQGGMTAGSTGVFSGTPSVGSLKTRYDEQKLNILLEHPFPGVRQTKDSFVKKHDEIFVTRTRFRYDGDLVFPAFNSVFAEEDWKVTEYTLGFGVGADGRHKFGKFSLSGGASVNLQYYWGEYDGSHHYVCTPCAPALQNFRQSTDDSKDGFTWGLGANAALHYSPNRSTELFLRGEFSYRDKSVALATRVSPNDPPPHLKTDSAQSARLTFGLRYSF